MDKKFFAVLLTEKPELLKAVIAFNNASVTPEKCSKRLCGDNAPCIKICLTRLRGRLRTADFSPDTHLEAASGLQAADIAQGSFWDFAEESRRLALLDAATLRRLAHWFGAAVHAREIAAAVARDEVMTLKDALGRDVYAYALTRGRFALSEAVGGAFCAVDRRMPLAGRVVKHGREAVRILRQTWPAPLRARTRDLFSFAAMDGKANRIADNHRGNMKNFDHASGTGCIANIEAVREAVWTGLKKILIKEVAPQWAPCFN